MVSQYRHLPLRLSLVLTFTFSVAATVSAGPPDAAMQGNTIDRVQQNIAVLTQQLQTAVAAALHDARRRMADDPSTAQVRLKLVLEVVRSSTEVPAGVRHNLEGPLKHALRQTFHRKRQQAQLHSERMARASNQVAEQRQRDQRQRDDDKLSIFMDRLDSPPSDTDPAAREQVIAQLDRLDSDHPAVTAATTTARLRSAYQQGQVIAAQRTTGNAAALLAVEKSTVGTTSSITYPSAETWRELTERRLRYTGTDLQQRSAVEEKITNVLFQSADIDFEDTPLDEVAEFLSDQHDINVVLDLHALADIGINGSSAVSIRVRGISLRSALRLALQGLDPEVTFSVHDEVLWITTQEKAEQFLITRSYPVADLVLPIQNLDFAGSGGLNAGAAGQGFGADAFRGGQGQQNGLDNLAPNIGF
ncbi:MAG TPA: hypothetical protein VMX74_07365 [Pirellulales bacterium]|nr:hypothetical protein [Pirellulales bacterium]